MAVGSTKWRNMWQSAKHYNRRLLNCRAYKDKEKFKKSVREREDEAYKFMKKSANKISARDEFCTFGNFVADNVRKLKPINQILAKRQITNMLMDLQNKEMETCERQYLTFESPETSVGIYNSDTSLSHLTSQQIIQWTQLITRLHMTT